MPTELRGQVGSSMRHFQTESSSFGINVIIRVAHLAEHWASIPKVVGSMPAVVRHIFQLARCGYKLRVTPRVVSPLAPPILLQNNELYLSYPSFTDSCCCPTNYHDVVHVSNTLQPIPWCRLECSAVSRMAGISFLDALCGRSKTSQNST